MSATFTTRQPGLQFPEFHIRDIGIQPIQSVRKQRHTKFRSPDELAQKNLNKKKKIQNSTESRTLNSRELVPNLRPTFGVTHTLC
jgi:hypothetical protein